MATKATKPKTAKKTAAKKTAAKKTAAKKKLPAPDDPVQRVAGVNLAYVHEDVLVRYAAEGERLPANPTAQARVKALAARFKKLPKSKLAKCDVCDGTSPLDFAECPFCGEKEVDDRPSPKQVKVKGKGKPVKADSISAALAEGGGTVAVELVPEKQLDENVSNIRSLVRGAAEHLYDLGSELKRCHDDELWKLRRTKKGEVAYTNFKQFCVKELSMSHTYAYKVMSVAAAFPREKIKQIGVGKLHLVLQVPEEEQSALLGDAESGATRNALSARARELKAGSQPGKPSKPEAPKPRNAIVLAIPPGSRTLIMQRRPTDAGAVGAPTSPARSLRDDPWAIMRLANDVTMGFRLTRNPEGELALLVEVRRGKEVV